MYVHSFDQIMDVSSITIHQGAMGTVVREEIVKDRKSMNYMYSHANSRRVDVNVRTIAIVKWSEMMKDPNKAYKRALRRG